ncbi:MAG: hypothetical protein E7448_08045 [Ruminococcaceae bacterium]|nr:hypothetical protein [Oscillospiraceae bacterium]
MGRKIWLFLLILLLGALGLLFFPKERQHVPITPRRSQPMIEDAPTEAAGVSLPYEPEEWDLIVEELISYDGPYIEDGTNAPVSDVAGVILHNAGDRGISFAVLALEQGNGTTYFTVTWLPPGERVLVLAMQRAAYSAEPITDCRVLGIRWDAFVSAPVSVQICPDGALEIRNLTIGYQEEVCLRIKQYWQEEGMYFGGITQCVKLPVLIPEEICVIYPEDFSPENAKIVAKVK